MEKIRLLAPETLPRCLICEKRVPCFSDRELAIHVNKCFKAHTKTKRHNKR